MSKVTQLLSTDYDRHQKEEFLSHMQQSGGKYLTFSRETNGLICGLANFHS